ncbi:MAG: Uma2 family endonuclease [Fimbriimonadales bacterium]|nr:Uma2 family endonuclease [Fimbriimonadales bacterium]
MAEAFAKPARRRRRLTEQEFLRLPDDGRKYELVDGEASAVPVTVRRDVIAIELATRLKPLVAGTAYLAGSQAGFRMATGNIRSPDVSVIFKASLPEGKLPDGFGERAPDLAIEIVSPHEDMPDLMRKIGEYFASGARQVWLLFPEQKRAIVYDSPFEQTVLHENDFLTTPLIPEFRVRVGELFEVE